MANPDPTDKLLDELGPVRPSACIYPIDGLLHFRRL